MFQYGTDDEISNFLWSAVMVETIHVLQKEQEMGNIKACFLMLVFLLNLHLSVYIKSNMADRHFRGAFLSPVNTFGCYTTRRPRLSSNSLTCQAPPGGFLPRTRWGMALSGSCHQVSTDSAVPPKSVSGRWRVSNRRATGLWDRPSKPSDRYSKS